MWQHAEVSGAFGCWEDWRHNVSMNPNPDPNHISQLYLTTLTKTAIIGLELLNKDG
jgi:hypothetical protein